MRAARALQWIVVTAVISCIGCASDKHLTRDRAGTLISKTLSASHPYVDVIVETTPVEDRTTLEDYLVSQGLLHMVTHQTGSGMFLMSQQVYELTPKGREFAAQHWYPANPNRYEIAVGDYRFVEITGIQRPDATHALVKYTYQVIPNDFGKTLIGVQNGVIAVRDPVGENLQLTMLGITATAGTIFNKQFAGETQMTLYDDSWRVGN